MLILRQFPLIAWGLAGLLAVMLVLLAGLYKRRKVSARLATVFIVTVLLVALIALTVHIE